MQPTTVYSAFSPADAHLIRSQLEAAGFHAIVTHELSSLSMEGYAMAAGGILVQVPESEGGDALEFLASARDSAPSDESNPTEPE
ncbi:MAG: DUF2007 domain-containing protein [Verrucomicrobiota bacterium]|jgi:hypothetical protein|nr:DUF2007 domain-containing protein [Verrucomicrobiota bacterium]